MAISLSLASEMSHFANWWQIGPKKCPQNANFCTSTILGGMDTMNEQEEMKPLVVRLKPSMLGEIRALADRDSNTVSSVLRQLIAAGLRATQAQQGGESYG